MFLIKSCDIQVSANAILLADGFAMLYPFKHLTEKYTLRLAALHDRQQRCQSLD